jgi:tryptophan synthase alpha chain
LQIEEELAMTDTASIVKPSGTPAGSTRGGLDRIQASFDAARAERRAALMPYYTLGYPDLPTSELIVRAIADAGADLIELGVPFSDPLADGPTIQYSTQTALEAGATMSRCLETTARLRGNGLAQPLLLMGYYNPILAYGIERFVADATSAGADGFIVPDLPIEEANELEDAARTSGRALVFLIAPTSPQERIAAIAARSTGFTYLVSLTGVTGARDALPFGLADFVAGVRAVTHTPLAVGFGISTQAQARAVAAIADGVIVGSALINAVRAGSDPQSAASSFVAGLRAALVRDS